VPAFRPALLVAPLLFVAASVVVTGCGSPPEPTQSAPQETDPNFFKGGSRVKGGGPGGPPPPVEKPDPYRIALPADGGAWPWNLAPAPAPPASRPVAVGGVKQGLHGFAVNPNARRAAVSVRLQPAKADGNRTRLVLCDTAAGKVVGEWEMAERVIPHDISDDGSTILARQYKEAGDGEKLVTFTVTPESTLKRKSWMPHDPALGSAAGGNILAVSAGGDTPAEREARQVLWAKYLPGNRVASVAQSGQFRVFDAQSFALVGSVEAVAAVPAESPDGSKLAVLLPGDRVALYDPATNSFVATRKLDQLPAKASLALSPNGRSLAVGGEGRVTFLDLGSGESWSNAVGGLSLRNKAEAKPFGWAGDAHLLAGGTLLAPRAPAAVWTYSGAEAEAVVGREVWAVVADAGTTCVLRPFALPHPRAAAATTRGTTQLTANGVVDK
jgi:hypothetical protein